MVASSMRSVLELRNNSDDHYGDGTMSVRIGLSFIVVWLVSTCPLGRCELWADCRAAQSFLVPPEGTSLPADAVLYAFVPGQLAEPSVRLEGDEEASATLKRVSENETFNAYEIRLTAKKAGELEVIVSMRVDESESIYARSAYQIDPEWKRPEPAQPVTLREPIKELRAWECSHNQTWNLYPSVEAMAYRVEFAKSPEAYRAGDRELQVFPPSLGLFFDPHTQPDEAELKLGHANCLANTFRWPAVFVYVGVAALHPDGSVSAANDEPVELPWSFGEHMYGPMTDDFYEEVHGKPE